MKKIFLDKKQILEYQQNRDPYLLIDYASEIIPGKSVKGFNKFEESDWFFKVHWPKDPNVPGMMQVESLVQMSALAILTLDGNKGKIMYLTSANKIKFYKKILPNSKFNITSKVLSYKRGVATFEADGYVDSEIVCKASFSLVLPDEVKKYSLGK
tara:strand:- start:24245 stop:24709 length:465 start_codon:yes stop_codon:yes gene_type:complete